MGAEPLGGVDIEVEGPEATLETFVEALREKAPRSPHCFRGCESCPATGYTHFEIRHSEQQVGRYS
jgi:hydrogenase maturation factor HypF (carbamoyltransferase family)